MAYCDDRILVLATLFLVCALLSAVGLGTVAFWAFLPTAVALEILCQVSENRSRNQRRMQPQRSAP